MYCKKCGQQIADDSQFCPTCGANQYTVNQVNEQPVAPTYQTVETANQEMAAEAEDSLLSIKGLFVPNGRRSKANFTKLAVPLVILIVVAFFFMGEYTIKADSFRSGALRGISNVFFFLWLFLMYVNAVNMSKRMMDCNNNKYIAFGLVIPLYLISQALLDATLQDGRRGIELVDTCRPMFFVIWVVYIISNIILMCCKGTPGTNKYGPEPK